MRTSVLAALAANRFATRQGQVIFFVLALTAVTTLAAFDLRLLVPALISVLTVGEIWGRGAQVRREAANKQAERERETQRRNREEQKRKGQRQQEAERRARAEQQREAERRRQQEGERRARAEQERQAERCQQAEEEREAERNRQRARTARPAEWWIVLGVSPNASKEQIVENYRRLIRQYHPDRVAGLGPEFTALAESRSKAINAAYAQASRERR